jgi:hypothetical protein
MLKMILFTAVESTADDQGWANLGSVCSRIHNTYSTFDQRNYGFGKFYNLVKKTDLFHIVEREGKSNSKVIFLKKK